MKKQNTTIATTIATAEKRVIKHEIATLKKAQRKVVSDRKKEQNRITREIEKLDRQSLNVSKATAREFERITRRIHILQGRLS